MRLLIFRWISRDPWRRSHPKTIKKKLWSLNIFCRQEKLHRTSLGDVDDKTVSICTRYTNKYRYKHTFQSQRMLSFSKSGVHFVLTGTPRPRPAASSLKIRVTFVRVYWYSSPLFKPVFGSLLTPQFPAAWYVLHGFSYTFITKSKGSTECKFT